MPKAQSPFTGRWWRISATNNSPIYEVPSTSSYPNQPWPTVGGHFIPEPPIAPNPPFIQEFGEMPSTAGGTATGTMPSSKKKNKLYNIPLIEAFSSKLSKKAQDGEIGLEIECEGMNLFNAPIQFWGVHSDGSLRSHGDHPPVEYVLRKPLPREEIPKALTYLSKKLKEAGSEIDESVRTSVHVHLNCQKLSMKEITKIWCLYTIFEEVLVNFSGPSRVGNLFCLRSKDAEHQIQIYESALQSENYNELFSDSLRYTSCNTASLGKFGSLEFRSMRGTVDQALIQLWVDTLLLIRDKALEYDNPTDIVEDFQSLGPEAFLDKITRNRSDIRSIFGSPRDYYKPLWDGLRLMRDVAYAVKWEKYDPKLKVEKKKRDIVQTFMEMYDIDGVDVTSGSVNPAGCYVIATPNRYWVLNTNTTAKNVRFNNNQFISHISGYRALQYTSNGSYNEQSISLSNIIEGM